ncbi:bile acid:sodium symporter family protein [Acidomonas methanolica]|uniref:Bile acid/Na+ symporter n=1 Tax=Acidomonas methanolica NBRC 104435 TaxID=1231351 RepID=A0A023D8Z7_ACIMT|nr:bile acid:sodium symporter family protein [Acidomonas methanolica]MBU2655694.1 bile acid:sodium symporter [Acidomonas methanolica]TCS20456.1 sodium/bile acid cotransporter 7 [Acidomonas methanolica]GAJ30603.1 bile acid/Na+ symporter [Acidomonas methanolica NBRC 104435]GBQ48926.1 bile acid/Na+ symporter [Acidomonas methanolica]GEL00623.1 bile acid:sodium symporter [Acidomonas methanolica NBRC 104435]
MRKFDPFLLSLISAILLATLLPCRGVAAVMLHRLTFVLIALMFFLHGARLEPRAVLESARNWTLQSGVAACTFVLFPLLGLGLMTAAGGLLDHDMWQGVLFLCCLPSTVQSSIALTSIARGNVPAAICAATLSNLAGIVITPILVALVLHRSGAFSAASILDIATQLLLPFGMGQLLHTRLHKWVHRNKKLLTLSDRGAIVLVVYTAFSAAVVEGVWHRVSARDLLAAAGVDGVLLAIVLLVSSSLGRLLRLDLPGIIALTFCGSKKSLATGIPMANVLFPAAAVGTVVLPLMMYHQIQLFVCTLLARHLSRRPEPDPISVHA